MKTRNVLIAKKKQKRNMQKKGGKMKALYKAIEKVVLIMSIPLVIVISSIVTVWIEIEMSRKRRENAR